MPITVPRYDRVRELPAAPNTLPSVRQTAAPTADMLGGNARVPTDFIGAGLKSAAGDATRIFQQMQDREDADLIFRAETVLKEQALAKSREWSERKGVQAWDVTKEAGEFWNTEAVKAGEGLNERQRAIFGQTVAKLRLQSLDAVSRHEANERRASLVESNKSSIVGTVNFAAANADNPDAILSARSDIDKRVQLLGQLQGWTPERLEVERGDALTNLHAQVLQTLVDRSPEQAEAYYAQHQGEIDGAKREQIEKGIRASTSVAKAQAFADDAMARNLSEADAIKEARAKLSGDDEVRAVAEIKTRHAELNGAREREQRAALDEAYGILARTGSPNAIPPSLVARLDGKDWLQLQNSHESRLAAREQRAAARESREDRARERALTVKERDGFALYSDMTLMAADDPEAFASIDLRQYDGKLSDSQKNSLLRLQVAARKGAGDPEIIDVRTVNQVLKPIVDELKYTGAKNADKRGLLTQRVMDRVKDQQTLLGRRLKQDEVRAIADELVIEGTVERTLWPDPTRRRFEVLGTDDEARFTPKDNARRSAAPAKPPVVSTQSDFDALPKGARFTTPDGRTWVK